jgi:hypothetical protein
MHPSLTSPHWEFEATECARDRGPYEVRNARRETQSRAGKFMSRLRALIFFNLSGLDKALLFEYIYFAKIKNDIFDIAYMRYSI